MCKASIEDKNKQTRTVLLIIYSKKVLPREHILIGIFFYVRVYSLFWIRNVKKNKNIFENVVFLINDTPITPC